MNLDGERLVTNIPWLEHMIVAELAYLNFAKEYFQQKLVLDNGCGTGHGADFVAGCGARRVIGIDVSYSAVHQAKAEYSRPNLSFLVQNSLSLAFPSASFDFVSSIEVIEHLADTEVYLSEIHRVLKSGGWAYLSTPNKAVSSPNMDRPSWPFHVKEFYLPEFRSVLTGIFDQVQIWGVRIPVYESHPIRKLTKSPLSYVKHILPPKLRLGIAAFLRYKIKPALEMEDVVFSETDIETADRFVALCHKES